MAEGNVIEELDRLESDLNQVIVGIRQIKEQWGQKTQEAQAQLDQIRKLLGNTNLSPPSQNGSFEERVTTPPPPSTPRQPTRTRRETHPARAAHSNGSKKSGKTKYIVIHDPIFSILRQGFSQDELPPTREALMESYDKDWANQPVTVSLGRGKGSEQIPLGEEMARSSSQTLSKLRTAVGNIQLVREDKVPPGTAITPRVRHLAGLIGQHPPEKVKAALKVWGIG